MQRLLVAVLAALLASPAASFAQRERDDRDRQTNPDAFRWEGRVPEGQWISLHNLNGPITVEAGTTDQVEVRAETRWRRGDPNDVRFETVRDGDNVVICALWFDRSTCDADGMHSRGRQNWDNDRNDVSVHFTVRLPRGVKVRASTVNGAVDVSGARSEVVARTVNGRVDASTASGPVHAQTVNGAINVRMEALGGSGDMEFETVNGSVSIEAPANLAADVSMSTVNGSLNSEFPLTVQGRISKHRINATINGGGRRLTLKTVNGRVDLKKTSG
jgi:opacity protein-like surface antigen